MADTKHVAVAELSASISDQNARIAAIRVQAQGSAARATSRMYSAAKEGLDTSTSLARTASAAFTPSSARSILQQLAKASTTIEEGEEFLKQNSTPKADDSFQNALIATEKLGVFLRAGSAIHKRTGLVIDEPSSGTVSSAAPVSSGINPAAVSQRREHAENSESPIQATSVRTFAAPSDKQEEGATEMQAAPTSAGERSKGGKPQGSEDSGNADSENEGRGEHPGDSVFDALPLSAPTSLFE